MPKSPLLVAAAALLVAGASSVPAQARTGRGSLKYFGYYASAAGATDHTAEVSDHANFTFIYGNEDGVKDAERLQGAARRGLKGLMMVGGVFLSQGALRPKEDYERLWAQYVSNIRPHLKHVAAFFIADEPEFWIDDYKRSPAEVKEALRAASAMIKKTFPGVPTAINYSWGPVKSGHWDKLDPDFVDIDNVGWVSFDCYGPFEDCNGLSIPEYLAALKAKLRHRQKILLVPEAWWQYSEKPTEEDQRELVKRAEQYFSLAVKEPRVIGLMPFIWQSPGDARLNGTFPGTRDLPLVREKYRELGRKITGRSGDPSRGTAPGR